MIPSDGVNQEIVDYIFQAQKHGLSDVEIKQNLLHAGWESAVVEKSFNFAKASETPVETFKIQQSVQPHPQISQPQIKTTPGAAVPHASSLSEQHFQKPAGGKKYKAALLIMALLLFLLGGGAYAYYTYIYITPQKIWNKFLIQKKSAVYKSEYSLNYSFIDQEAAAPAQVTFGITGELYNDLSNTENPQINNELTAFAKNREQNLSANFKLIVKDKVIYLDLNALKGPLEVGKYVPTGWIKIDTAKLKDYLKEEKTFGSFYKNQFEQNKELQEKLKAIWKDKKIIIPTDFLAKEDLNGVAVYHIKNQLDSNALADAVIQTLSESAKALPDTPLKISENQKKAVRELFNKFQIKNFDVWIGQQDYQLYKIHITFAAPSAETLGLDKLNLNPLDSARAKSRDAKRLADIRQIASALELYYNDQLSYPTGSNGKPEGISPNYFNVLPTAPMPPDGTCTDYYNSYWYEALDPQVKNGKTTYNSYKLTFCLGRDVGGYQGGIAQATPKGIEGNIPCPTTPEQCSNGKVIPESEDKKEINAQISLESRYFDFEKIENILTPAESTDIIDVIKAALDEARKKARDAKRVADVMQMSTALELYYNDSNQYPNSLDSLIPNFIPQTPTAPTPADGSCTEAQNAYKYVKISSKAYELTFCLGDDTGGHQAGKRSLTAEGIK